MATRSILSKAAARNFQATQMIARNAAAIDSIKRKATANISTTNVRHYVTAADKGHSSTRAQTNNPEEEELSELVNSDCADPEGDTDVRKGSIAGESQAKPTPIYVELIPGCTERQYRSYTQGIANAVQLAREIRGQENVNERDWTEGMDMDMNHIDPSDCGLRGVSRAYVAIGTREDDDMDFLLKYVRLCGGVNAARPMGFVQDALVDRLSDRKLTGTVNSGYGDGRRNTNERMGLDTGEHKVKGWPIYVEFQPGLSKSEYKEHAQEIAKEVRRARDTDDVSDALDGSSGARDWTERMDVRLINFDPSDYGICEESEAYLSIGTYEEDDIEDLLARISKCGGVNAACPMPLIEDCSVHRALAAV